jgi:uncharacterized membrane protein
MSARRTLTAASLVVAAAVFLAPVSAQASWFAGSWLGLFSFRGGAAPAEGCIPSEIDDCGVQEPPK